MNNIMIDIIPIALLIIIFYKSNIIIPISELNKSKYLSKTSTTSYRGIFAIVVILHHLSQKVSSGYIFPHFIDVGYLAVAIFFFFSGYGLLKSLIIKKDEYKKGFLLKRIPNILFPYLIITLVYWIFNLIIGNNSSVFAVLKSFINGSPYVPNSWYIIYIILFYIVFWILINIFKEYIYIYILIGSFVWFILFFIYCDNNGIGNWWYISSHIPTLGMIWAVYEEKILGFLNNKFLVAFIICVSIFSFLFFKFDLIVSTIDIRNIYFLTFATTAIFFVLSFLLFVLKINIGNKVLEFLGEISLEIYLLQGIFISIFRGDIIYINNDCLYSFVVIVASILWAYLFHILFKKMMNEYKCFLKKHSI